MKKLIIVICIVAMLINIGVLVAFKIIPEDNLKATDDDDINKIIEGEVTVDPETFEVLEELQVTKDGFSVRSLNELECVGNDIFANVFQTTRIVRIDKSSGRIISEIDGFRLSAVSKRVPDPEAVLNGIAHDPERNTFFVTGKLWQSLFEIQLGGG